MAQRKEEKQKIYILHLIESLRMGGAEIALLQYIQALGKEDYCHYIYSFGPDGPIRKKIEALGLKVNFGARMSKINNPVKFFINLWLLVKDLLSFVKDNNIHIIQSHLGQPNQLAVLVGKLSGVSTFPTVHSTNSFLDNRSFWNVRVHIIRLVNAIIYRMADRVITVSSEVKSIISKQFGLDDSKVMVLKNGIIEPVLLTDSPLQNELSDKKNNLKIVAVGRLIPLKRFDTLIKAVAEIVKQGFFDLSVCIIGEGEERLRLEKMIYDLKIEEYVKLLGVRDDVLDQMRGSDIFVIPSIYEGLSIAMIEALSCGLPVIASEVPGLKDCICQGENGIFFQVGNYNELAQSILLLANDKKMTEKLSAGARASFEKEYDMRENIKSLNLLFHEYAEKR